ncbi:3-dehydroquinate synthase [Rubripirellula lacrimiformis]|uniref:3-dehydroquinate synthase n=1 Tax=Rubripirellula lacrimiformis TaxID=1930273 RepID=A0A517N9C9_9BACT|nr:3-dehydroquinate synthase [Rubripirellula lacrimiformis]QDT03750.1 3-dehydroquinate synthase [Rubripirellula lacrimiformis]
MPDLSKNNDRSFAVPFVHRLRVTNDVAGRDFDALQNLLECGEAGPARVLLIGESVLEPIAQRLSSRLAAAPEVDLVTPLTMVDGGEAIKNGESMLRQMLDKINQYGLDRRSYIIAVGGGAMLDAVGFAAAIAHRGIRLIRIPSTVLAQADSGVGVKNAINYFEKKNWIGTFAVPWAVVNDMSILSTLPNRDFHSGFSEAVKVALLKDRSQFLWLCDRAQLIHDRETATTQKAIHQSCLSHLDHITEGGDPFEMLEARPLDFGHWSAHRLEPLTQYSLRHGEAVAIGVAIDCLYSVKKHGFPAADADRVIHCLTTMGMKLWHDSIHPIDRLLQGLEEFRQHLGGRLTITMLKAVGEPINVHEIDSDAMREAIETLASRCS